METGCLSLSDTATTHNTTCTRTTLTHRKMKKKREQKEVKRRKTYWTKSTHIVISVCKVALISRTTIRIIATNRSFEIYNLIKPKKV
jgi:hypothetical protein